MNYWNRKRVSKMFIADGESHSYSFEFDKSSIHFSSQYYPDKYRKKIKKLNDVIAKYMQDTLIKVSYIIDFILFCRE